MEKEILHLKGEQFELFCYNELFKDFEIMQKAHPYSKNYPFIKSDLMPDFKFYCKETKQTFWIECKYNSIEQAHKNYQVEIKKPQFLRYKKLKNVFYLIGIDLEPNNLEFIYLVPYSKMFYDQIYLDYLETFQIPIKQIKNFNELLKLTSKK